MGTHIQGISKGATCFRLLIELMPTVRTLEKLGCFIVNAKSDKRIVYLESEGDFYLSFFSYVY